MRALVCEVVAARTMAELRAARDRAETADLVELRLDYVSDVDVAGALKDRRRPVIVTCRAPWEGGHFKGSEEDRLGILDTALQLGAEYVDVEWRADRRRLSRSERSRLVVSLHDFTGFPADLAESVRGMRAAGDIVKVSVMANALSDCVRLRDLFDRQDDPHVAIAMGPLGQVTRVHPAAFGSLWTYAGRVAPGQVSASDLVASYRVPSLTEATAIYAVTGWPLAHSASPAMHNAAFAALGMDAVYVPLATPDAAEFESVARALGVKGASVTAPHKQAWIDRVQAGDDVARHTGAINTLQRTADGWDARNFDAEGLLAPLDRQGVALDGRRVVVLGAGGAARAAVWALASRGARVEVSARRADRARALAEVLGASATSWPPPPGWDVLVNATPVGTWPRQSESPLERRDVSGGLVYDLVYNPVETTLMRQAREEGVRTIGGLDMLVAQAVRQFEWWTGRRAPEQAMARAAEAFVKTRGETDETDHV